MLSVGFSGYVGFGYWWGIIAECFVILCFGLTVLVLLA